MSSTFVRLGSCNAVKERPTVYKPREKTMNKSIGRIKKGKQKYQVTASNVLYFQIINMAYINTNFPSYPRHFLF